MSGQTVELASAKWLSAEQAAELGAVSSEAADGDLAIATEEARPVESAMDQGESTVKTMIMAVVLGAAAFGVVFAFPTGTSPLSEVPAEVNEPVGGSAVDQPDMLEVGFGEDLPEQELTNAEVMEMAADIMVLKAKRAERAKAGE